MLYLFDDSSYTWNLAKDQCNNFGGSMIKITQETNTKIFMPMIKGYTWIGIKRVKASNLWYNEAWNVYIDGTRIDYSNWATNEPNSNGGLYVDHCVCIHTDGKWFDDPCPTTRHLLCEIQVSDKTIEIIKLNLNTDITIYTKLILSHLDKNIELEQHLNQIYTRIDVLNQTRDDLVKKIYQRIENQIYLFDQMYVTNDLFYKMNTRIKNLNGTQIIGHKWDNKPNLLQLKDYKKK